MCVILPSLKQKLGKPHPTQSQGEGMDRQAVLIFTSLWEGFWKSSWRNKLAREAVLGIPGLSREGGCHLLAFPVHITCSHEQVDGLK